MSQAKAEHIFVIVVGMILVALVVLIVILTLPAPLPWHRLAPRAPMLPRPKLWIIPLILF